MTNELFVHLEKLYQSQYVSFDDLESLKSKFHYTLPTRTTRINTIANLVLRLKFAELIRYLNNYRKAHRYLTRRERLNREFIKREQRKQYQIEGNNLDPQQIEAVVACEDAELILAPAGSGKTASLLAKLNYLVDTLKIPPQQILVIAFTNKVVAELQDRIKDGQVEIRTFHSLGNKLVKDKLKNYHLISEQQIASFVHQAIESLLVTCPDYKKLYNDYLSTHVAKDIMELFDHPLNRAKNIEQARTELEPSIASTLSLQKNEQIDLPALKSRIQDISDSAKRHQACKFFELYAPIFSRYEEFLNRRKLYDFSDMLNLATATVKNQPSGTLKYQYILVDEAQDLSSSKYHLLKAILDNCQKVKLFAVGDDWQSIYRFAGSNLSVLDDFEQIFQRHTYRGLIELTYRFGQPTAKISNKFIQKNPRQSKKRVKPHVKRKTPITIKLSVPDRESDAPPDYESVNHQIQALYQAYGEGIFAKRIQIISRYNHDIFRLINEHSKSHQNANLTHESEAGAEFIWFIPEANKNLTIPFCSMHKAKGITRDIILVINANSGQHGIPATRNDDPVTEILLSRPDAYPFAEERRLFYVAITRAKEQTIIFSEISHISPFVFEISPKLAGANVEVCPRCHRGVMQASRQRDGKICHKCSNFTGGCHYAK